ncbi:glycosyltransferase [mine drainage metagenome]|uniref:Glycosyltransferase n=2 Tax=mine drainage metagenome TaxID=410659 RepID=T1ARA7_9ZZZZ
MRIAFVSDVVYPWVKGGVESIEYEEAKELAKTNEVHMFCMRFKGMEKEFVKEGIHYHAYTKANEDSFYINGRRSIKEAARFSLGLKNMFRYKFDVVQANMFPVMHIPIVRLYCRLNKAKLILDVAEVWDREYWRRYIGGIKGNFAYKYNVKALRNADFYIADSSATESELLGLGISKRKIEVFSPFLGKRLIGSVYTTKRSKRIITSGRLIKEKRLDKFIKIMAKVIERVPDTRALIIGKGPEKEALEKMIHAYGLDKKIKIRDPFRSKKELYRAIKGSSAMLQMSEREGLSAITVESIALGTPVFLPSYTPIPKEVRGMCTVADENALPKMLIGLLLGNRLCTRIRNRKNLEKYYTSNISRCYAGIFKRMGLRIKQ